MHDDEAGRFGAGLDGLDGGYFEGGAWWRGLGEKNGGGEEECGEEEGLVRAAPWGSRELK